MKKIIILLAFFVMANLNAQEKKPAIILYDNGTWEKVAGNEPSKPKMTIEETWTAFQKAVKSGKKEEITKFVKFPFLLNIRIYETEPVTFEYKCIRPLCKLGEILSKSKLDENFNLVFSKDIINYISKIKFDEYIEGQSDRFKKNNYDYKYNTSELLNDSEYKNGNKIITKKNVSVSYNFYFIEDSNEFKLYLIGIER